MMVRTGANTFNFHHPATERRIEQGELLMIDMSAAYHHYHGNTARALSLGENPFWAEKLDKLAVARDVTVAELRPGDPTQRLQELMDEAVDAAGGLREYVWWVGGYVLGVDDAARLGRPRLPERRGGLRDGRLRHPGSWPTGRSSSGISRARRVSASSTR